jgi:hypothetical protein
MTTEEKQRLVDLLTESQTAIRNLLEGVDLETRIYSEPSWQIRDILGHIAGWDREAAKSLCAFNVGEDYAISEFDENEFNENVVHGQRSWTVEQVLAEWDLAREDFKAAILEILPIKFPGDVLYPWGDERGCVAQLVEYMVEHDAEHRDDIGKALRV